MYKSFYGCVSNNFGTRDSLEPKRWLIEKKTNWRIFEVSDWTNGRLKTYPPMELLWAMNHVFISEYGIIPSVMYSISLIIDFWDELFIMNNPAVSIHHDHIINRNSFFVYVMRHVTMHCYKRAVTQEWLQYPTFLSVFICRSKQN